MGNRLANLLHSLGEDGLMAVYPLKDKAILLWSGDDVAVAKEKLAAGTELAWNGGQIRLTTDTPPGHKIALRAVSEDAPVHKYGQVIGYATAPIAAGDWVHTQNLHNGSL